MKKTNSEEQVLIGKVGSPNGLKGEVRITLYQHDSTNLKEGKVLLLKHARNQKGKSGAAGVTDDISAEVQRVRYQKDRPVVKLEGIDDRNAAEAIRGLEVYILADALEPLPEGEHYVRNIIGCRVIDIAGRNENANAGGGNDDAEEISQSDAVGKGREIGVLRDVIQNTAQSILEVETPEGKTVLIPAVDEFMRRIDEDEGIIEVELIPGFI